MNCLAEVAGVLHFSLEFRLSQVQQRVNVIQQLFINEKVVYMYDCMFSAHLWGLKSSVLFLSFNVGSIKELEVTFSVTGAPSLALFSNMLFLGCPPFRLGSSGVLIPGLCGDRYAERCWIILDVQPSAEVAG